MAPLNGQPLTRRNALGLYLALCAVVVAGLGWQWVTLANTRDALCALRGDIEREQESSVVYLERHPEGAPSLGITAAEISAAIARRQRTLHALRGLDC